MGACTDYEKALQREQKATLRVKKIASDNRRLKSVLEREIARGKYLARNRKYKQMELDDLRCIETQETKNAEPAPRTDHSGHKPKQVTDSTEKLVNEANKIVAEAGRSGSIGFGGGRHFMEETINNKIHEMMLRNPSNNEDSPKTVGKGSHDTETKRTRQENRCDDIRMVESSRETKEPINASSFKNINTNKKDLGTNERGFDRDNIHTTRSLEERLQRLDMHYR